MSSHVKKLFVRHPFWVGCTVAVIGAAALIASWL